MSRSTERAFPPLLRRYLAYVVVAAVAIAAAALYSGSVVKRTSRMLTTWALRQSAEAAVSLLRALPEVEPGLLSSCAAGADIRLTLIRADGVVIADTHADPATLDNHGDRQEIREAFAGRTGIASRPSASVSEELLYVALPPVEVRGQHIVVRASAAPEGVRGLLAAIYREMAIAALAIFAAVAAATLLAERRMIAPIGALERAAAAFARGELAHPVRVTYPPDIARVGRAMEEMATALRERIREVEERRNELEAIFAGMAEAVIVLDPELRLRTVNAAACALLDVEAPRAAGRTLLEVVRSTELSELAAEVLSSSAAREAEMTLRGTVHLQVHGAPLARTGGEKPSGVVLVLGDVSRLKRLEEVRRDFVANVSHELKTPITSIKGGLETLLDGAIGDPDASRRFLLAASRNAERLHAIVDDLLSLSALERPADEARTMEMEPRDLGEVAHGALQLLSRSAEDKHISLSMKTGGPARAWIHPRLAEQAIANLVDNAIKYSPPHSAVTVHIERRGESVAVAVEDHGIGIPSADLPRVFERFYRVDKARSRELGGTGLGLAIVKHIALVHGGSVEAASVLGKGSTFTVLFPALEPATAAP